MRPSLPLTRLLVGLAMATAMAVASGPASHAASSAVTVTMNLASNTTIGALGCGSGTAATQITAVADVGAMTTADCVVQFGSSNDTASLRVVQRDGLSRAMYRSMTGPLDTSFGTSGRTITPTGTGTDLFTTVARDPNGMFVAAGSYWNGTRNKIVVARFQANGTIDPLFNGGAVRTISLTATDDVVYSIAVQPDRKIVMAGIANSDSLLMRLNVDGTTDWTQINNLGTGKDWAKGVALDPSGRMLVYGIAYTGASNIWNVYLERRTAVAGALDPGFASAGRLVINSIITEASPRITVAPPLVLDDGRIVVCDYTTSSGTPDLWLLRTSSGGVLDGTFGASGTTSIVAANNDYCGPGAVQADGKVVFPSATLTSLGVGTVKAVRVGTTGSLDATFLAPAVTDGYLGATMLQEDDRIVGFGISKAGGVYVGTTVRWLANGTLDSTHGTNGVATVDIGSPTMPPQGGGSTWGADGMPVSAGSYWNGTNDDLSIYRQGTTTIPDYGGATTWASVSGAFGACLASVAGPGVTGVWTAGGGTCTPADNGTWNGIPLTTGAAGSVVARSTTVGVTTGEARLRFAMRATPTTPIGSYVAPITFDVIAPMV